jgi:hypothetical protein
MTFALIAAVVITMTVYFKRTIQGRIAGAHSYAGKEVGRVFTEGYDLAGGVVLQYEPYYIERVTDTHAMGTVIDRRPGGVGTVAEIQEQEFQNYRTISRTQSNQLAPKDAY